MQGISKRYGGVRALQEAGLTIEAGRIHAVLGENGAGKSTLIKIMAGVVAPDEGQMLLEGHPVHRTAHAALLKTLQDHLAGVEPSHPAEAPAEPIEPLSERELAVLRFLPTNLTAADIGSELFLSVHTVKTHMRKLYAKLDVHTRAEAVQRGRALGLLAPARRGN